MSGKPPHTKFLVRVMNPHSKFDRCIVPKRSEAFGNPGNMRVCSKEQKTSNNRWHQGQGAQDNLQVWPMSREKIDRHLANSTAHSSAQTNNEEPEPLMNTEKALLCLQITMLCIKIYMV